MNRGSARQRDRRVSSGEASMRPRFMNRGSDKKHGDAYWGLHASMRPRFMNRGSPEVGDELDGVATLQ